MFVLGVVVGIYGVSIGSGGGFLTAPLLIIFFDFDYNLAAGTSLITVALSSISGSIAYLRLGYVYLRGALLFSIVAIPGTILGVFGLRLASADFFQFAYGILLGLLGLYVFINSGKTRHNLNNDTKPKNKLIAKLSFASHSALVQTSDRGSYKFTYNELLATMTNGVIGFISGFLGIGGGPIRTPALVYLFGFPIYVAIATSLLSQIGIATIGSIIHIWEGNVDLSSGLILGLGMIVGAQIAVKLSRVLGELVIMRLLALSSLAISVRLIISGINPL
jgi:hypothetical protein